MNEYIQERLTGERALFQCRDAVISYCTFADGESPLKESSNLKIDHSLFEWKYPLWYSKDVEVTDSTLYENARAGIWYTDNIKMTNIALQAPKTFRRCNGIELSNVTIPQADETLWNCNDIKMTHVSATGNYFGMNSSNIELEDFSLSGNYAFDGGRNITIRNSKLLTKDAFWNCDSVTVINSFIGGQYVGWNSKNITFIDCTIESDQGFCYMDNVVLKNCRLLNTDLAFEYCTVDADVKGKIDSVKNPISGRIKADRIGEIIFDNTDVERDNTEIVTGK